eukprot:232434-Pelagomonas_calceolata.AAC.1
MHPHATQYHIPAKRTLVAAAVASLLPAELAFSLEASSVCSMSSMARKQASYSVKIKPSIRLSWPWQVKAGDIRHGRSWQIRSHHGRQH